MKKIISWLMCTIIIMMSILTIVTVDYGTTVYADSDDIEEIIEEDGIEYEGGTETDPDEPHTPRMPVINVPEDNDDPDTGGMATGSAFENPRLVYPEPDPRAISIKAEYDEQYPEGGNYSKYATPVKDQGQNGLCWAFAATAVMETALLKAGKGVYDLSESHMAYALSNHGNNIYGVDRSPSDGSNCYNAAAYMMRGMPAGQCIGGMVQEINDPYNKNLLPDRNSGITFSNKKKVVMPENIMFINTLNTDVGVKNKVKDAIVKYGSVGASMYYDVSYCNMSNGAYYENAKDSTGTNHQVQIVGWDDNYSKYNFKYSCRPSSNGAWVVKNSWGTQSGSDGYYYISYSDSAFPANSYAIDGVRDYDSDLMSTYEYDYNYISALPGKYTGDDNNLRMRYYMAESDEVVTDISVYVGGGASNIEVDVVPDMSDVNDYVFHSNGSVITYYPGWYTIKLERPVLLKKGIEFGAVVHSNAFIKYDEQDTRFNGYRLNNKWHICQNEGGVGWCIKARTSKDPALVESCRKAAEKATEGNKETTAENTEGHTEIVNLGTTKKSSYSLKPLTLLKPKAGKRSAVVRWKKITPILRLSTKKVEIQYSTNKKFKKNVRKVYVSSKKASKKITGLKKGKKYYIRIRAYTKSGNTVKVSKWSKIKTVKVK